MSFNLTNLRFKFQIEDILPAKKQETIAPVSETEDILPANKQVTIAPFSRTEDILPANKQETVTPVSKTDIILPANKQETITPVSKTEDIFPANKQETITPVSKTDIILPANKQETITPVSKTDIIIPAMKRENNEQDTKLKYNISRQKLRHYASQQEQNIKPIEENSEQAVKTNQITSFKKQKVPFKETIENTLSYFPKVISNTLTDTDEDTGGKSKDTAAILGLVFGAASVLIILISLALTAGTGIYLGALLLSMCLGIAGLSRGIEGLKSEKNGGLALAGIILGSATLICAIILFALALKNNML